MALPAPLEGQRELISFLALTLVLLCITNVDVLTDPRRADREQQEHGIEQFCQTWNAQCSAETNRTLPCWNATEAVAKWRETFATPPTSAFCVYARDTSPINSASDRFTQCEWPFEGVSFLSAIAGIEAMIGTSVYLPSVFRSGETPSLLSYCYFLVLGALQFSLYLALDIMMVSTGCGVPNVLTYFNGAVVASGLNLLLLTYHFVLYLRRRGQGEVDAYELDKR